MKNGIIIGTIACMVAVILVGSVLAPVIDTTTTVTTKVNNDGAIGLKMEKITSGDFVITFDEVDGEFTAINGTNRQVIDDVCIFYADDNVAVWMDDSSVRMFGVDANDQKFNAVLSDTAAITITKTSEGVNITDGTVDKTFPVPSWSFVPKSTGAYGFFLNETEVNTAGMDTLFVGSFAGVDCYNGINAYDLPITLDKTASGSTLSGAKWTKAATEQVTPDNIEITPLDPSVLDPSVPLYDPPTPQYTDGDWGYNLAGSDATIVSYSGTGGGIITVPATVGGYAVTTFGNGNTVFDRDDITATGLVFSEGIKTIGANACYGCPGMTGFISIPSTVTNIGVAAFNTTGFDKTFIVPESVTNVANQVITNTAITGIVICGEPSLSSTAFNNPNIKEVLNLGDSDITTTSGGMGADEVRSDIPALGYIAAAQYSVTVENEGPMAAMFAVIPLIMVIAILMFAVGFAIYRRME